MKKETHWIQSSAKGISLRLKIQPQASHTQIVGLQGDPLRLKIRVAAPPVEGKANEELLQFLKKLLKLPISQIKILRGETSASKDILFIKDSIERIETIIQEEISKNQKK